MGTSHSKKKQIRFVIMVGLDGAGKTMSLYNLKLGDSTVAILPTIGFNIEEIHHNKSKYIVWDVGGQCKYRRLWRSYFDKVDGIVFVVDSTDAARFPLARKELDTLLVDKELAGVTLLVLANKQDVPNAVPPYEVAYHLGLFSICNRLWYVQGSSALSGDGLNEGLTFLQTSFPKDKKKSKLTGRLPRRRSSTLIP
eukprot:TRINITY_DN20771_c0_g1_i1.p1 TRINITY_DN20771_c0_g1~~TRINITY_DN20771_c0_g1_i1.p1  ORF type:complete len:196 (-),score=28.54 TRINITY_DN20771_c0_g1_i1:61-648(-)